MRPLEIWTTCGGIVSLGAFAIVLAATLINRTETLVIDMPDERPGHNLIAMLRTAYGIRADAYRLDGQPDKLFVEVQSSEVEKATRILTSLGYNPRKEQEDERTGLEPDTSQA